MNTQSQKIQHQTFHSKLLIESGYNMQTLDEIGIKYNTDKASPHHNYLKFYEGFFSRLREKSVKVLEIGILSGASLATWEEYFPNATIIGADINPSTVRFQRGRIQVELLDQSNIEHLTSLALRHGPFDIVIEDGSHMWEHQKTTLKTLFPFIKENGIYIVEDLQTNYGNMVHDYKGVAAESCVEYLKKWLDLKVADDQLDISSVEDPFLRTYGRAVQFLSFYRRACLIQKDAIRSVQNVDFGKRFQLLKDEEFSLPLMAHVGVKGDVYNKEGYINFNEGPFDIQAIRFLEGSDIIEYRVRLADATWTDWVSPGTFLGTSGNFQSLSGITVRLKNVHHKRYRLRTFARFGSREPIYTDINEDLISPRMENMHGIQVVLAPLSPEQYSDTVANET